MKKIGILYHPLKDAAQPLAEKLKQFLTSRGIIAWSCSAWEVDAAKAQVNSTDLIISIGGDGTILRAAQTIVPEPIPIIGINLGHLGFMTELQVDEAESKLLEIIRGDGWIDERTLLQAELTYGGRSSKPRETYYALNDVVLARGAAARVIYVDAIIDGELLTTYKADGVIVATATGSTGYALAAGGPVLHPQERDMLMVPIMPHLSSGYSMVLPPTVKIKLRLGMNHPATFSIDGHINLEVPGGSTVRIVHSSNTVRFLRIHPEKSFYGSLEQRLKGN